MKTESGKSLSTRQGHRLFHIVAGGVAASFIYLTPDPGSLHALAAQLVALPALVISGLAMWLWPRLRRRLRVRSSERKVGYET